MIVELFIIKFSMDSVGYNEASYMLIFFHLIHGRLIKVQVFLDKLIKLIRVLLKSSFVNIRVHLFSLV